MFIKDPENAKEYLCPSPMAVAHQVLMNRMTQVGMLDAAKTASELKCLGRGCALFRLYEAWYDMCDTDDDKKPLGEGWEPNEVPPYEAGKPDLYANKRWWKRLRRPAGWYCAFSSTLPNGHPT